MKTLFALLAAVLTFTVCAAPPAAAWYESHESVRAILCDGTGGAFRLEIGAVFPVSRVMAPEEMDPDDLADLTPARAYFVLPMSSGFCAMAPAPAGRWVQRTDPSLAEALLAWQRYDMSAAKRVTEMDAQRRAKTAAQKPALHRRFSSPGAEAAYNAGKLPEYLAAREAEATQAAQLEQLRRISEQLERLRRR